MDVLTFFYQSFDSVLRAAFNVFVDLLHGCFVFEVDGLNFDVVKLLSGPLERLPQFVFIVGEDGTRKIQVRSVSILLKLSFITFYLFRLSDNLTYGETAEQIPVLDSDLFQIVVVQF